MILVLAESVLADLGQASHAALGEAVRAQWVNDRAVVTSEGRYGYVRPRYRRPPIPSLATLISEASRSLVTLFRKRSWRVQ